MLISTLSGPVEVSVSSGGLNCSRKMPDSSSSSAAPSTTAKRACDACHRRKVKCIGDGTRPCKNCTSAGLTCTYNAIPQKKGPKGSRAKVISELRETQRQSQLAAKRHGFDIDSPPHSPAHLRQAGLLSMKMMTTCVDYFFANLYPTQPILHRQKVGEVIGQMEQNVEAYCLVVSLCAYMMIQPNMVIPPDAFEGLEIQPQPSLQLGHALLQEALRVRRGHNYIENPSIWSVITSFFFFGSYFCLDRHNTAWFHLREATTLAQIMGMHDESSPFDDTFVGLWNKARVGCTTEWLARLQQQLTDALPQYLQCTESQAVDLRCSQQWLRTMVWQLSISHGFLSSAAADNAMSFKYPIEISRDLVHSASQFSQQSMEVHGVGLIEKLFDVACTLTDVMSVIPQDQYTFEFGPRDYLNQLMTLISTLRGGQQRYMPLLMQKINDSMPNTGYALPAIPPSLRSEEVYDGSHSSAPTSHDSTPFGSPLSAGAQPFAGYGEFPVTSAIQYPQTTESGPTSNEIDYITAGSHSLATRQTKFETGG
ncbi:putative sucrose utilization protein SUC1, partial [Pseudocercospora fuligena]